jgi:hypothetical protein
MKDNCIYGELWATRNRPKVLLGRAAVSRTAIDKVSPATPPRRAPRRGLRRGTGGRGT